MFQPGQLDLDQGRKSGNVTTWPGLMAELNAKYLLKSDANIFVNLDQTQKNISTKS